MRRVHAARFVVLGCLFLITSIYAVPCPKGTFVSNSATNGCRPCPNGTYSDRINSRKCSNCAICRGRHNSVRKACTRTSNSICMCQPGYYFEDVVLFCLKCDVCKRGHGVKKNCTANSNTVCASCEKGKTYSDSKDLSSCKPCAECGKGDTLEKCSRKSDTVCLSNDSKEGPSRNSPTPSARSTAATPWLHSVASSHFNKTPPSTKRSRPISPKESGSAPEDAFIYRIALYVLSAVAFCIVVAFSFVIYRYKKWRSKDLPQPEPAAHATASTRVTAQENHYATVKITADRTGSQKMLREVPYTLINELAKHLNPGGRWKVLGGHLEFNNTEISNFALVKENATQVMLEEWGQRDCATVANLLKTFTMLKWQKEEKICADYV